MMKLLPIFEAVLRPYEYDQYLKRLENATSVESIDDLEQIFDHSVRFITPTQYKTLNPNGEAVSNLDSIIRSNNGVGGGTVIDGTLYVFCDPKLLLKTLNTSSIGWLGSRQKEDVLHFIRLVLRHESIHIQQIKRSKGKVSDVDKAGNPEDFKKYLANKQEIMAYAQSIVDEVLRNDSITPEMLLKSLKRMDIQSSSFRIYQRTFKNDPKVLNLLCKYIYYYIRQAQDATAQ